MRDVLDADRLGLLDLRPRRRPELRLHPAPEFRTPSLPCRQRSSRANPGERPLDAGGVPAPSAWGGDVLVVQFASDRGDVEPCFVEFPDPLDHFFADLPRPPELDSLRTFDGERVPCSLTDQPALELRERREHRWPSSPRSVSRYRPRGRGRRGSSRACVPAPSVTRSRAATVRAGRASRRPELARPRARRPVAPPVALDGRSSTSR